MMTNRQEIASGIFLIADPSMDENILLDKLIIILKERIVALQIWDNFRNNQDIDDLIQKICALCHARNIPVLINNKWEFLNHTSLDGVHFDNIPENFDTIKKKVNRPFLSGLTCNNDLSQVYWAEANQLNYISFCSMFPSTTANSCELVKFKVVREARKTFSGSIFLAGGIKPTNMKQLNELEYTGIAVVSGIMNSDNPDAVIKEYYKNFK